MPELPEIETLKRTLEPRIVGARVVRVRVLRSDVITRLGVATTSSGDRDSRRDGNVPRRERKDHRRDARATDARTPRSVKLLEGDVIASLIRHGKQLAIIGASGRAMCFHLGMSGQVRLIEASANQRSANRLILPEKLSRHVHCIWRLQCAAGDSRTAGDAGAGVSIGDSQGRDRPARGRHALTPAVSQWERRRGSEKPKANSQQPFFMIFRDPRRFGGIRTSPDLDTLLAERWSALGPDALSITPGQLRTRLSGADRGIKSVLLDQSVLAGMGNIYADEALFRAGIHPLQPARELSGDEVGRLVKAMRWVLRASIRGGGSTLRDYADANGKAGGYVARHAVYGRAAQPCVRCGQGLVGDTIAQRATVYCEVCQPRKVPI